MLLSQKQINTYIYIVRIKLKIKAKQQQQFRIPDQNQKNYQNLSNFCLCLKMSQNTRDSQVSIYKVIVVGQSGVGKSNIVSRYVYDKFQTGNNITIGVQFVSKMMQVKDTQVNLQIWDTAGQQRFRSVNKVFYKNALGALVVFSLANKQTFLNLPRWLKQIRQQIQENAVLIETLFKILILIGNKSDLKQREITVAQASKFAKQQNMAYIETSAALNINIEKAFEMLSSTIIANFQSKVGQKKKQSIFLTQSASKHNKDRSKKACC